MSQVAKGTAATDGDDLAAQYRAGRNGAILAARSDVGRLLVRGRDALDLLHRLSTNDLRGLGEGEGRATVFTTNKGRILDLVTLHRLPGALLALCGEGRAAPLRDWIDKYTFREEVSVEDGTEGHGAIGFYGPLAGRVVAALWGQAAAGLPLHHLAEVPAGNERAHLVRTFPLGGDGYLLTAPVEALEAVRGRALQADGVRPVEASSACLDALRIEAGLPAAGRELTEEYNPWEARLEDAISLDKGCYVGQEVIARLHTYKKVSRLLVRLTATGDEAASAGEVVIPGAAIQVGGATSGVVTSSARLPGGVDQVVALGYVRDEDALAGRPAAIAAAGRMVAATIEGVAR